MLVQIEFSHGYSGTRNINNIQNTINMSKRLKITTVTQILLTSLLPSSSCLYEEGAREQYLGYILSCRGHYACHGVSLYLALFDQRATIESDKGFFLGLDPTFPRDLSVF